MDAGEPVGGLCELLNLAHLLDTIERDRWFSFTPMLSAGLVD
jgi:hypothetical protein